MLELAAAASELMNSSSSLFGKKPGGMDYAASSGTLSGGSFNPVQIGFGIGSSSLLIIAAVVAIIFLMRKK